MRNEQNIENTNLNPFEAPADLWGRVEAGLDEKKSKQKGFIWWYVAAGIALVADWTDPQPLISGNSISVRTGGCAVMFENVHVYRSRGNQVTNPAGFGELMSIESENAIETGLVNSIVLDASDNWSAIESEEYLLDFSAPELDFVNDGTGSDIDTFLTATFDANWLIEDIHSDIANFDFAIGTAPNLDDVVAWNSNGVAASISEVLSAPINGQLYYVSVRAENHAGWESEFVSDGQ